MKSVEKNRYRRTQTRQPLKWVSIAGVVLSIGVGMSFVLEWLLEKKRPVQLELRIDEARTVAGVSRQHVRRASPRFEPKRDLGVRSGQRAVPSHQIPKDAIDAPPPPDAAIQLPVPSLKPNPAVARAPLSNPGGVNGDRPQRPIPGQRR